MGSLADFVVGRIATHIQSSAATEAKTSFPGETEQDVTVRCIQSQLRKVRIRK